MPFLQHFLTAHLESIYSHTYLASVLKRHGQLRIKIIGALALQNKCNSLKTCLSEKCTLTAPGVSSPKDSALGTAFCFCDEESTGHYYVGWILLLRNWCSEHFKRRAVLPLNEKDVKLQQFELKQMTLISRNICAYTLP